MTVITGTAVQAATISDAAGTGPAALTGQSAAKAWGTIDVTGTAAISESFGMSSVTDVATGIFDYNLSVTMSSSDYATATCGRGTAGSNYHMPEQHTTPTRSTTALRFLVINQAGTSFDPAIGCATFTGDLA